MYSTPKRSVCLVTVSASCAGLFFVLFNSACPQETKKANPRIKELQQQRLAILREIHDAAKKLFADGRTTFEDVHAAERELLAASLANADTQKDRIKVCDEAVREALEWQKIVKEMKASAKASQIAELKAQAYVLETRITREKAEADE